MTEADAIRATFTPYLLDDKLNGESCPLCKGWICSFPHYKFSNWKGKRSHIAMWECWNCKTEFVHVEIKEKR